MGDEVLPAVGSRALVPLRAQGGRLHVLGHRGPPGPARRRAVRRAAAAASGPRARMPLEQQGARVLRVPGAAGAAVSAPARDLRRLSRPGRTCR
ncbi:hypothetical protein LT493_15340 [Streptomyces tricolor]|nr:hypothetical protein [Streptomyces tricolor]